MNSIARRLKAATRFPSDYSVSKATQSSQLLSRGISRSYHKPCHLTIYQNTVVSQHYLNVGSGQRQRWLSSSSKANKSEQANPPHKINERGGIWIYIGWTILGLVGVDQALQYKQEQEDIERRQMLSQMQVDADNASINVADWDETLPTIFTCKILHVDPGLDGTKMLTRSKSERSGTRSGINRNIQKEDIVEVLEAGVGPSQRYHLCRMREQKSDNNDTSAVVGWYPIDYLQRLD